MSKEITLRKAAALQTLIFEKINGIELTTAINLNEFQDPEIEIPVASNVLSNSVALKANLWKVYYEIRTSLGSKNETLGISAWLSELARLEKLTQLYKSIVHPGSVRTNKDIIAGMLTKIKESKVTLEYGYRESNVHSGVLEESAVRSYKLQIDQNTREKQALNDAILELNVSNRIELSDFAETILISQGIL